jgi:hypothetical protein
MRTARWWSSFILSAVAVLTVAASAQAQWSPRADAPGTFEGPVGTATCGAGSRPETAIQGEVPKADRKSGRSAKGYSCNLDLIGQYQGQGASWVDPSYSHCAYVAQHFPGTASSPGVQVLDVADPAHPKKTATLSSPAMLGTWESLKVDPGRELLAAVSSIAPLGEGPGFFDIYDVADCAHPKLLNSVAGTKLTLPVSILGHEGGFSPDGRTYWSSSATGGVLNAIDVSNPATPKLLYTGITGISNHGFGFSPDGSRMYMAEAGLLGSGALLTPLAAENLLDPNGMQVFDVSEIQHRVAHPQIHQIGEVTWQDGAVGQHAIPVTYNGHDYVIFVDEMLSGGPRIIDVSDPTNPRVIAKLKLAIQMPAHADLRKSDTTNPVLFGYDSHYCTVDRTTDPTALACGEFASGVRVFDIRDPMKPREIAYYNPPAQVGKTLLGLPASEHAAIAGDMTTDWCSSPPRFVGEDQLWVTCQDNGFMTLRFTNKAWPLAASAGLCSSRRTLHFTLPRGATRVRLTVDGKKHAVNVDGRRARLPLKGLPRRTIKIKLTARVSGRAYVRKSTIHLCTKSGLLAKRVGSQLG